MAWCCEREYRYTTPIIADTDRASDELYRQLPFISRNNNFSSSRQCLFQGSGIQCTHTPKVLWWFFPKSHLQKIKVGFCQHNISPPLVEDLFGRVCFEAIVLMNQTFGMLQPLGHSVLNTHAQKLVFELLHWWWWWLLLSSTCLNDSGSGFFKNIINIEERDPKSFIARFLWLCSTIQNNSVYMTMVRAHSGKSSATDVLPWLIQDDPTIG